MSGMPIREGRGAQCRMRACARHAPAVAVGRPRSWVAGADAAQGPRAAPRPGAGIG